MLKVLLLIIITNTFNGEIADVGVQGFATMAECEAALESFPQAPQGYAVNGYCVDPAKEKLRI